MGAIVAPVSVTFASAAGTGVAESGSEVSDRASSSAESRLIGVPVWSTGDSWSYTQSTNYGWYDYYHYEYTLTVNGTTQLVIDGTTYTAYRAERVVNYQYVISSSGTGWYITQANCTMSGPVYYAVDTLATLRMEYTSVTESQTTTAAGTTSSLTITTYNATYTDPWDSYHFPLAVGEEWNETYQYDWSSETTTQTGTQQPYYTSSSGNESGEWEYNCTNVTTVNVPAGSYSAYSLRAREMDASTGNYSLFYFSAAVKNSVASKTYSADETVSETNLTGTEVADTTAPTITSAPSVEEYNATAATIAVVTDEPSHVRVEYGTSTDYGANVSSSGYRTDHTITLTALSPSTLYHFRAGATDESGNGPTWSADATFTTAARPDTTPPSLVSLTVATGRDHAWVNCTTDEPSYVSVEYGQTAAYGLTLESTEAHTEHRLLLDELAAETEYHYRLVIDDTAASPNTLVTDDQTFTTTNTNYSLPRLVTLSVLPGSDHVRFSWSTEPATGYRLQFGPTPAMARLFENLSYAASHTLLIEGLNTSTTYFYRLTIITTPSDLTNTTNGTVDTLATPDRTPPSIIDLDLEVSSTAAWLNLSTDEAATVRLIYGFTTAYGVELRVDNADMEFSFVLEGLLPGSTYHYRLILNDTATPTPNMNMTHDRNFTTLACSSLAPPILDRTIAVSDTSAHLGFKSDTAVRFICRYGPTRNRTLAIENRTFAYSHRCVLLSLSPSSEYYFTIEVRSADGRENVTSIGTFTTLTAPDTTLPTIVGGVNVTLSRAKLRVQWLTDEPATSRLQVATTAEALDGASGVEADPAALVVDSIEDALTHTHELEVPLAEGTTYYFRVGSTDAFGNGPIWSGVQMQTTPDLTAPAPLSTLNLTHVGEDHLVIEWSASTAPDLDHYALYCTEAPPESFSALNATATTTETGYNLTGLVANRTYFLAVGVVDSSGNMDPNLAMLSAAPGSSPENGTLYGTVSDANDATIALSGAIISGIGVESEKPGQFRVTTNTSGAFIVNALAHIRYRITVRCQGYVPVNRTVEVTDESAPLAIQLEPAYGTIGGVLRDAGSGGTIMDAHISVLDTASGELVAEAASDGCGRIAFERLRAGQYSITVEHQHYQRAGTVLNVEPGEHTTFELWVTPDGSEPQWYTLSLGPVVTTLGETTHPVSLATVTLQRADGVGDPVVDFTTTTGEAMLSIPTAWRDAQARVTITIEKDGYIPKQLVKNLGEGATLPLSGEESTLHRRSRPTLLLGPFVDEEDRPISGAIVTLRVGGTSTTTTTNASGYATVTLEEGWRGERATVAVEKSGYDRTELVIDALNTTSTLSRAQRMLTPATGSGADVETGDGSKPQVSPYTANIMLLIATAVAAVLVTVVVLLRRRP